MNNHYPNYYSLAMWLIILCLLQNILYGHDLKTPRGSTIIHKHFLNEGWTSDGETHTAQEWTAISDGYYATYYIERVDMANKAYNCHAYAWAQSIQANPNDQSQLKLPVNDNYFCRLVYV